MGTKKQVQLPPWKNPKRVLVVQTAFLGDIVLTTSFLKNLRALLPEAEIAFLTTPIGASILEPNPWRIKILPYDKRGREKGFTGFLRKVKELREYAPELIFSLHRSFRSTLLARAVPGAKIFGFTEAAGSAFFAEKVSRKNALFEADKNNLLLQKFAELSGRNSTLGHFPELQTTETKLLGDIKNFVVLAPSSVWATKRWPAERFGELALALAEKNLRTVIVGGKDPDDQSCADLLLQTFSAKRKDLLPLDLTGKTNLPELKAVIAKATLVIANDSAPLHIAIAVGVPVLGVFGPTTKELGFFPLAPEGKSAVVERVALACRPCGLHGHKVCPQGHFRCMLEIDSKTVLQAAEGLLPKV